METIKCVIVDDEPSAINNLRRSLEDIYSEIEIVSTHTQWSKALEALRLSKFDILFLDINMQGRDGMDLLRMVPDFNGEVIFVTAYAEHAVTAFQLQAAGYLLKPIDESQFVITIEKVINRIKNKRLAQRHGDTTPLIKNKIGIPTQNVIEYVNVDDIIYCESASAYTGVVTRFGNFTCSYNLGKFKTVLDDNVFFQPHRSFVINLNHVIKYNTSGTIIMSNEIEIPIARDLREDFQNHFSRIKGKS